MAGAPAGTTHSIVQVTLRTRISHDDLLTRPGVIGHGGRVGQTFDLVVVGGGMAGLTAAARAARDGARVAVVERAEELGGSARYAGYLWTGADR